MANIRDGAVEKADNLGAQLAASFCRDDAYKSKRTSVKEDLVKPLVEWDNRRWTASELVAKAREASANLGGALQADV